MREGKRIAKHIALYQITKLPRASVAYVAPLQYVRERERCCVVCDVFAREH